MPLYGFYSAAAARQLQNLYVYTTHDGREVVVTEVSPVRDKAMGSDAELVGEVVSFVRVLRRSPKEVSLRDILNTGPPAE